MLGINSKYTMTPFSSHTCAHAHAPVHVHAHSSCINDPDSQSILLMLIAARAYLFLYLMPMSTPIFRAPSPPLTLSMYSILVCNPLYCIKMATHIACIQTHAQC